MKIDKNLFAVVWVPDVNMNPASLDDVINSGGRVIDGNLSKSGAEEVERCVIVGTSGDGHGGKHITIGQKL